MKRVLSITLLLLLTFCKTALAFPADTSGWACNDEHVDISASEIDLKSDIKNDFRIFQTTLTNLTNQTMDVTFPLNASSQEAIAQILKSGLTIKELMTLPKQIVQDSYKEDLGTGKIATAHKSLVCLVATGGAIAAGAGLIGIYPQQKTEEFISHKRIKKEFKKLSNSLVDEMTLAPFEQRDIFLIVPIDNNSCLIQTNLRDDESDVYSDYHQL